MKRYKLKKWYPSLHHFVKEGDILQFENTEDRKILGHKYGYEWYLPIKEVEEYTEFWEEIVEKDYEILSIRGNLTGQVYSTDDLPDLEGQYLSCKGKSVIWSVKRLSDGEVFTVGDKVKHTIKCGTFIIEEFMLCKDNYIRVLHKNGSSALKYFETVEECLFTTEDGVDIYDGDMCWCVSKDYYTMAHYTMGEAASVYLPHVNAYFHSKEKAEEWIRNNKPKYSLRDIEEAMNEGMKFRDFASSFKSQLSVKLQNKKNNE